MLRFAAAFFVSSTLAFAAEPPAAPKTRIDAKMSKIERRVLEILESQRSGSVEVSIPERTTPPKPPPPAREMELVSRSEESYSESYRRALRERKPLLIWVGGEFCPT
jgi:hypothetical protein